MAEESFQERTEKATPKRREDARKKGQVARSAELSSVAVLSFSLLGLLTFGPLVAQTLAGLARHHFQHLDEFEITVSTLPGFVHGWLATFGQAAIAPAAVAACVGITVAVLQVGWKPSAKALEIKWEKFNIVKGLGRLLGRRSLFNLSRDTLKLCIIGSVAYLAIAAESGRFPLLVDLSMGQTALTIGGMALRVGFKITAALLVIAAVDYAYQKWEYEKNLRMTKQQVKEEVKHLEGDPQIKARVRRIQRELSRRRMMQDVAEADVVVTNPTHLAVALRYDRATMAAPTVVAKGAERLAEKIRAIAVAHGVPVIENRPLARALYRTVAIGVEIPEALFEAAAAVLAMAYRTRRSSTS
jgi:flagellar biosynthetic protein FlhB